MIFTALEEIFNTATEKVLSINGCITKVNESTDTSCDNVKGCEQLSVITPRYNECAKSIIEPEKDVTIDNDVSRCTISSDCVEIEKPHHKDPEESSNFKTLSDYFDSDWEFKQNTVKEGKGKVFLSLASHNGKLLSFSDNDQKHETSERNRGQTKGISLQKNQLKMKIREYHLILQK